MKNKTGKCYIVGAGDFHGSINPCEDDLIIAADGGLDYLENAGIVPDVIVGDFDSLDSFDKILPYASQNDVERVKNCHKGSVKTALNGKNVEIVRYPVMKDETDMCIAYRIGASKGYSNFELYGGVGGREDHSFANYCLLLEAKNDKNDAVLIGKGVKIFVIKNEKKRICGRAGATVSAFAFGGAATGVNILGLKYEARNITLDPSFPLGVSNSFADSCEAEISVLDGALLLMVYE